MNPYLLAFIPGALIGLAVALLFLRSAPRTQRASDVLRRYDTADRERRQAAPVIVRGTRVSERVGGWLSARAASPDENTTTRIPGFTTPKKDLDLLDRTESDFYFEKAIYAIIGLLAPIAITFITASTLGIASAVPLVLSPVLAFSFWFIPDSKVRSLAAARRREFVRFVTVYLELVSVALLGESTPDQAMSKALTVSNSWVFERIRREYRIAEVTRMSKWQALERLGDQVKVPALGEMARMMRMSDDEVGVRRQLRAACNKLRKQLVTDDAMRAEAATARMQGPIVAMMVPIMLLVLIPTVLQFITINNH
jgi:hypothetical protein